jgi:hypothetical protein
MEDMMKKGMKLLRNQISEDAADSSTENIKPLVVITPVSRTIFPKEAKECAIKVLSSQEDNEDTFLKCLYILIFFNYPELLQDYMATIADSWELSRRKRDVKTKIKTWMWLGMGLLAATGINFLIQLIPF